MQVKRCARYVDARVGMVGQRNHHFPACCSYSYIRVGPIGIPLKYSLHCFEFSGQRTTPMNVNFRLHFNENVCHHKQENMSKLFEKIVLETVGTTKYTIWRVAPHVPQVNGAGFWHMFRRIATHPVLKVLHLYLSVQLLQSLFKCLNIKEIALRSPEMLLARPLQIAAAKVCLLMYEGF